MSKTRDCKCRFRRKHNVPAYAEYIDDETKRYTKAGAGQWCNAGNGKCVYALVSPEGIHVCSSLNCETD